MVTFMGVNASTYTFSTEEVGHDLECFTEECLRAQKKRKVILQKRAEKSCYPS